MWSPPVCSLGQAVRTTSVGVHLSTPACAVRTDSVVTGQACASVASRRRAGITLSQVSFEFD